MSKHSSLTDSELKQAIKDSYEESRELGRREYYLRNRKKCVSGAFSSLREPTEEQAALWESTRTMLADVLSHMETEIRLITPVAKAADTRWRELVQEEKDRARHEEQLRARMLAEEMAVTMYGQEQERMHSHSCHCRCH